MLPEEHAKFIEHLDKLEKAKVYESAPVHHGEQMTRLISPDLQFIRYVHACGEAMIFECFDNKKQCDVAVKIARRNYNAQGGREVKIYSQGIKDFEVNRLGNDLARRFLRGAKIQQNLCSVIAREIGIIPTVNEVSIFPVYVVMEWVNGHGMLSWSLERPLPTILKLFCKLLRLVDAVHDCGIVHSDIKPGNIMVVENAAGPVPALLDFSLSKDISRPGETVTKVGTPIYTDNYGSPLMLRDAGRRSFYDDIFMLGKTLQAAYFRKELGDRRQRVEEMEPGLRRIVEQATHVDVKSRYRSVKAFLGDLEAYVIGVDKTVVESQDVIFDDSKLSDTEKNIAQLFYAGMVKIADDRQ